MKKMIYCAIAIVLALSLAGCTWSVGADSQGDDRSYDEGSGDDTFQYPAFSGDSSADIHHYLDTPAQDNMEPQQQSEYTREITFTNGESFAASKYDLKLLHTYPLSGENSYEVQTGSYDTQNLLSTMLSFDTTATELADSLADSLKASSGETPLLDIHEEGIYITGIYEGMIALGFFTDGPDGTTYALCMSSTDVENCIDILNSIIDDFLASDITESSSRTEYGDPVEPPNLSTQAGGGNFPVFTVPAGYSLVYENEFQIWYVNETTDIIFYLPPDEEFLRYLRGEPDNSYTYIYQMTTVGSYESENYGEIHIAEGHTEELYHYFAGNESGTVIIELLPCYEEQLSLEQCVELLKKFIG